MLIYFIIFFSSDIILYKVNLIDLIILPILYFISIMIFSSSSLFVFDSSINDIFSFLDVNSKRNSLISSSDSKTENTLLFLYKSSNSIDIYNKKEYLVQLVLLIILYYHFLLIFALYNLYILRKFLVLY